MSIDRPPRWAAGITAVAMLLIYPSIYIQSFYSVSKRLVPAAENVVVASRMASEAYSRREFVCAGETESSGQLTAQRVREVEGTLSQAIDLVRASLSDEGRDVIDRPWRLTSGLREVLAATRELASREPDDPYTEQLCDPRYYAHHNGESNLADELDRATEYMARRAGKQAGAREAEPSQDGRDHPATRAGDAPPRPRRHDAESRNDLDRSSEASASDEGHAKPVTREEMETSVRSYLAKRADKLRGLAERHEQGLRRYEPYRWVVALVAWADLALEVLGAIGIWLMLRYSLRLRRARRETREQGR